MFFVIEPDSTFREALGMRNSNAQVQSKMRRVLNLTNYNDDYMCITLNTGNGMYKVKLIDLVTGILIT